MNKKHITIMIMIVILVVIVLMEHKIMNKTNKISTSTSSPVTVVGVPKTSASIITSAPPNMDGINTHTEIYNGSADPDIITLGPKSGNNPYSKPYATKCGMEFELAHGTPLLAPIDMVFVGFQNNNAKYGIGADGQKYAPFNDVVLLFESTSPDWPSMIIKTYHLYSSPLLLGHYQNLDCGEIEEWGSRDQKYGHLFFAFDDYITKQDKTSTCKALIGHKVKRGELIGYAGSVGEHTFASFCFKVQDISINPTVKKGNHYLHWVQPSVFFYRKCYHPDTVFPSGVLAYPFECDGYQLPAEQRNVNFKYSPAQ
jgi:hypothetical protein